MQKSQTPKAKSLSTLEANGFRVPTYSICKNITEIIDGLTKISKDNIIVRSCGINEDLELESNAGQFKSVGPLHRDQVLVIAEELLTHPSVPEIIIQEFIDAPTGVILCSSLDHCILEYSRAHAGVTSGSQNPFVAKFPNNIPRYASIQKLIEQLFAIYGPFNSEISLEDYPSIFQIRPLTKEFTFDQILCEVKMQLQELPYDTYIENELCIDLIELGDKVEFIKEIFCTERNKLKGILNLNGDTLQKDDFVHFTNQIFVAINKFLLSSPTPTQSFKLSRWCLNQITQKYISEVQEESAEFLMRLAMALRIITMFTEKIPTLLSTPINKYLINKREIVRNKLISLSKTQSTTYITKADIKFKSPITKSSSNLEWLSLSRIDSEGQWVVEGDLESGPFIFAEGNEINSILPDDKFVLVCKHLYPEFYRYFPQLLGIICEGGAITSHLSILCREKSIPLKIQVSTAFCHQPKYSTE